MADRRGRWLVARDRRSVGAVRHCWPLSCAYRERRDALILERTGKVETLLAAEGMTDCEQECVHDMHYFATTFDGSGLLGGRLATLSEKQAQTLGRIHLAHAASPIPSPGT